MRDRHSVTGKKASELDGHGPESWCCYLFTGEKTAPNLTGLAES